MEDEQSTSQTPSKKHKLIKQTLCLCCCFPSDRRKGSLHSPSSSDDDRPRLLRASSTWLRSRAHEFPEISRHIISRLGGGHRRRHSPSAEYKYDPPGYSLNFDAVDDEAPARNFSGARSPPLATVPEGDDRVKPAVTSEITCS